MIDQYYTKPEIAKSCYDFLCKNISINEYEIFLEPCAGAGSFFNLFPKDKRVGIDIDPKCDNVLKQDFLSFKYESNKKFITISNPPFGKNSSLAKKFFNYAAKFSNVIAFIVPKTFKKVSTQNQLDLNLYLKYELDLPDNSFIFNNKEYSVPTIFQIWVKRNIKRSKVILPLVHKDFSFTTKLGADYSIRRVGVLAGKINNSLEFAESSNYFIKSNINKNLLYNRFEDLYNDFNIAAKNTAGNPSLSKTELIYLYSRKYD